MKKNAINILFIFTTLFVLNFTFADNSGDGVLMITTNSDTNSTGTQSTIAQSTGSKSVTNTGITNSGENGKILLITDGSGNSQLIVSGYIAPQSSGTQSTGNQYTGNQNTGEQVQTGIIIPTDPINPNIEFAQALDWMFKNGLTMYNNSGDFRMYDNITREEAAKMVGQAYKIFGLDTSVTKNTACTFLDSEKFNTTLSIHIANVCQRGLFQGANGYYLPTDNLSKAQSMAVLIRMIEGKMSYELQTPRWEQYYKKGFAIGLTNIENINEFDHNLTRYEMALMLYRMKPIMENNQMKTIALNTMAGIKQNQGSGTLNSQTVIENLGTLVGGIDASSDPELLEAIYWMSDNNLTMYKTVAEYKPFETLSRAGAAKIFDKFSDMLGIGTNQEFLGNECNFTDISSIDLVTQAHITNVCKKGLIKGSNRKFDPNGTMNKSSFIVALIRMFEGKSLDETKKPRRINYFDKAQELGLVTAADTTTFDTPISRYEVALFLYKFNIRYKMLNNLNNNKISDDIINTVKGSIITTDGKQSANIFINTSLLKQGTLDVGYIETFGTRYKIVKSQEKTENNMNGFVRYGEIFDIATDQKIGTINFVVQNGFVLEGTLRFENGIYKISSVSGTNAYYKINQQ